MRPLSRRLLGIGLTTLGALLLGTMFLRDPSAPPPPIALVVVAAVMAATGSHLLFRGRTWRTGTGRAKPDFYVPGDSDDCGDGD